MHILTDATKRGYASDWKGFETFCLQRGLSPIPCDAETLHQYVEHLWDEGKATRTVIRHLFSIHHGHKIVGLEPPDVKPLLADIESRPKGERATSTPIHQAEITAMLNTTRDDLIGIRDRLVLLLLWEFRLRRNICSLKFEDLKFLSDNHAQLFFQDGVPPLDIRKYDGSPLCLFSALREWQKETGLSSGRIIRSIDRYGNIGESLGGTSVNAILKSAAKNAGLQGVYHLSSFRRAVIHNNRAIGRMAKPEQV